MSDTNNPSSVTLPLLKGICDFFLRYPTLVHALIARISSQESDLSEGEVNQMVRLLTPAKSLHKTVTGLYTSVSSFLLSETRLYMYVAPESLDAEQFLVYPYRCRRGTDVYSPNMPNHLNKCIARDHPEYRLVTLAEMVEWEGLYGASCQKNIVCTYKIPKMELLILRRCVPEGEDKGRYLGPLAFGPQGSPDNVRFHVLLIKKTNPFIHLQ